MFNTILAHLGHSHDMNSMDGTGAGSIDHCMPIIVGAGIIITLLIGVIVYILSTWQPKSRTRSIKSPKG
ncbi:hypothetical protein D3C85_1007550 [compost metagenome]